MLRSLPAAVVVLLVAAAPAAAQQTVCPLVTPPGPLVEGRAATVVVGQPQPCPPPGRAPGDFTIGIGFGDGASAATAFGPADPLWLVRARHAYRRAGTYRATATITDRTTGAATVLRRDIVVRNAPLTARRTARPVLSTRRARTAVVARFADGNRLAPASDHRATIAWGDGTTSKGRISGAAGGTFAVRGRHAYARAPARAIAVRIRDDRGAVLTVRARPLVRR